MSKRQLEESRAAKATLFFSPCTKPQDNKLSITILCKPSLWKILNRCHSDFIKVCVLEGASFSEHLQSGRKSGRKLSSIPFLPLGSATRAPSLCDSQRVRQGLFFLLGYPYRAGEHQIGGCRPGPSHYPSVIEVCRLQQLTWPTKRPCFTTRPCFGDDGGVQEVPEGTA